MDAGPTLLALLALFVGFAFVIARVEGLTFLAPKSTKRITAPAEDYCVHRCRTADGLCPLTGSAERAEDCPLWKFVEADLPAGLYGNPFEHLRSA